ncbi:hypothetical protein [Streptosporangium sp. KLBMP 9127]|nr:hypothetical protein [Streptosporangium sp. KLBMP 9127]
MSVCDNEQLGAEPAAETCGLRRRAGATGASEGSTTIAGGSGLAERTASGRRMAVTA